MPQKDLPEKKFETEKEKRVTETEPPKAPPIMEPPKKEVPTQPPPPLPPPPPIKIQKERTKFKFSKRTAVFLVGGFFSFGVAGVVLFQILGPSNKNRKDSSPKPTPSQNIEVTEPLLPYRLSSAFIPLPPSKNPADLTVNWETYQYEVSSLFFKYPKEWVAKKIDSQDKIVRFSYPTSGESLTSFSGAERVYVLVSRLKKETDNLESQVAKDYTFQRQELIDISQTKALKIYNVSGGTNFFLFVPHGEDIILFEHHVKNPLELSLYEDIFLMIDKSIKFGSKD